MKSNRITDSSALTNGMVWVLLTYSDGSEFCFQTTLSSSILNSLGILLEEGKLPRLDKKYFENGTMVYRQYPYEGTTITLWDSKYYTHEDSERLSEFL